MATPYEGWRYGRSPRPPVSPGRIVLRVLAVLATVAFVVAVAGVLRDPVAAVREGPIRAVLGGIARSAGGLGPLALLVGVGLLAAAPVVGSLAVDRPERRVRVDGEPTLRFTTGPARRRAWALAAAGAVALAVALGWIPVRGPFSALAVAGLVAIVLGPVTVRSLRDRWAPEHADLTRAHFHWNARGGRVTVAWDDVVAVEAFAYPVATEEPTVHYLGLRVRPGAHVADDRTGSRRPERQRGYAVAVPVADLTADPERLYRACVAFRDRRHREALLAE